MKRDPHRLTYRVRRIPSTWTVEDVEAALLEGLGTTDNTQVRVRVLATDLSRFHREKCRTAVVSFGLEEPSWPPRFSLHGLGVKLDCDTVFDDLTPLSSCDRDEQHSVDCVVIPGWGGHPIGSFMAEDSPYLWILDGLGIDFPQLRIWTYGYGSSLMQQGPGEDIYEFADSFVRSLRRLRLALGVGFPPPLDVTKLNDVLGHTKIPPDHLHCSQPWRNDIQRGETSEALPLVYASYFSLEKATLTMPKAIIRMHRSADATLSESVVATYGALLFAVPSAGMDIEAIASMVGDLPARTTLHDLDARIGQRLRLRHHLEFCGAFQFEDSVLARFYERHESPTIEKNSSGQWSRTGRLRQLVTLPSASPGRPWEVDEEFIIGLEGDHSTLVKLPDYYGERRYERISDVLEKFLAVATDVVASRFQLLSGSTSLPSLEKVSSELASAKRMYGMALSDDEKELVEQKREKKRRECLSSLSFRNISTRYNRVEKSLPGTCQWVFQNPEYSNWEKTGTSGIKRSFLWIKGKAGSGKSTLMKTIVEKFRSIPSRPVVISFFFDARGNLLERSPLGLFRTLVSEIINERPQLVDTLLPLYQEMLEKRRSEWRMQELHQWFKRTVEDQQLGPVYVFIDALDECDEEDIDPRTSRDHDTNARTLVRFFEDLMTSCAESKNSLLLCLSSRHYPHITVCQSIRVFEVFMEGGNDQDIREFIKSRLVSSSLDTDLMREDLSDVIMRRSRGVFLWVVLVIQALLRARDQGRPKSQWMAILEGIPTTLNEMFRQIMGDLKDEDEDDSAILFQLLILGKESMSLECLKHAFAFAVDKPPASLEMWERSDTFLSEKAFRLRIRHLSCGLVEVKNDRSGSTIRQNEPQLRRNRPGFEPYVFADCAFEEGTPQPLTFGISRSNTSIGYVAFGRPYCQGAHHNHASSGSYDSRGTDVHSSEGHQTVQFVHETVRTFFVEILAGVRHSTAQSQSGRAHKSVMQACLSYMAASGIRQVITSEPQSQSTSVTEFDPRLGRTRCLFSRLPFLQFAVGWLHGYMETLKTQQLEEPQVELYRRLGGPSNKIFKTWKAVYYSVDLKHQMGECDNYIRFQADFFDYAAIQGLWFCVSAGLRDCSGAGPRIVRGVSPLMRLLSINCDGGARLLVAQGMDVRAWDDFGRSVLFYANSVEMIEMLHDAGAEVNGIWSPRVLETLKADERGSSVIGLNALMYHISSAELVEGLLQHGANVNETNSRGKTALHYTLSEDVARLILSRQPDVSIRDVYGRTASEQARRNGLHDIARLIDDYQKEVDQSQTVVGR